MSVSLTHANRPVAGLLVGMMILAASACSVGGPKLLAPHINGGRLGVAHVRPNRPMAVGEMTVCLSKPGTVTITKVTPTKSVGRIIVQAFAVRPNPAARGEDFLGDVPETLTAAGFSRSHVVDHVCKESGTTSYELGLQLIKPTAADVGAAGWKLTYSSNGHTGTVQIPFGVALCSGSASEPACAKIDPI